MRAGFIRSWFVATAFLLALAHAGAAVGQSRTRNEEPILAEWIQAGALVSVDDSTGNVRFLGAASGRPIANPAVRDRSASLRSATAVDAARGFLSFHGSLFGLKNQGEELALESEKSAAPGRTVLRFRQMQGGFPVLGGELVVQLNPDRDVLSVNGEISRDSGFRTSPRVDRRSAQNLARAAVAKAHEIDATGLGVTDPELWVYDPSLLGPGVGVTSLVWRMDVTADRRPIRELVLIDAERGSLALRFNQVTTTQLRETYTADNGTVLPGSLVCDESDPDCVAGDSHAAAAHRYAADTYKSYKNLLGRDSVDNAGLPLVSTVHYGVNYRNAFWDGTQVAYGDACSFPLADDVVAHEFTHGVTDYSSHLFYYYESGAINESISDIFGEFVDQGNASGNDHYTVRWLIGENLAGPRCKAIRDMEDPPAFWQPDRMGSPLFYRGTLDNGGVHINSGVNNKAAFLMTDGGDFNGKSVHPIGTRNVARIYNELQTNLLVSGADYRDLYDALPQACTNLLGLPGVSAATCQEVRDAVDAVEMWKVPSGLSTPAPVCDGVGVPMDLFSDNIDDTGGVHFDSIGPSGAWTLGEIYANSGTMHYWGSDRFADSDEMAQMNLDVLLPAGSSPYLRFEHAYQFEAPNFDGGVLEYSTDGGSIWTDAGPLFDKNGYNGRIKTPSSNPLRNRKGFIADSHGYTSSRVKLASLAGQSIRFRFRLGTDDSVSDRGWFVDDVRIYTCSGGLLQLSPAYSVSEAGSSANITVTRTEGADGTVSVSYATSDGSADGADYTPANGVLTFESGVASTSFSVPINDDTLDESNETIELTLSSPTNSAILGPRDTSVLTITDNDAGGTLQLDLSYSASEAAGRALIAVTRSGGSASEVDVNYATSDGTAIAGLDYTAASGTLTFGAGELSKSFPVTISNDGLAEWNETFNVSLSSPTGGGVLGARNTSVATIVDDETGLSFEVNQLIVSESAAAATITVKRRGPSAGTVGVSYLASDGTATAGLDFGPAAGTLTMGSGVISQSFSVPIVKDTLVEGNEAVMLSLFAPTGGAAVGPYNTAVLNINDDDPPVLLKFGAPAYNVNESILLAAISVTRLGPTASTVGVSYATSDGTATAGSDYGATSGTLTFGPGVKTLTFNVPVTNDLFDESNEKVQLALSSPTGGAFLGTPSVSDLNILDNDVGGTLQLNLAAYNVNETGGSVTVTLLRSAGAAGGVSVDYATSDASATAGSDYTASAGTLSFASGELSKTFVIPILDDGAGEGDEKLEIALESPMGGAVLGPRNKAPLTIVDDESASGGTLQLGLAAYKTSEKAGSLLVSVSRSGGATSAVSVNYSTSDGTATAGADYSASSGTLDFGANERTKTFLVPILNDTTVDGTETFDLTLSSPTGGAILGPRSTATASITDNEETVQFIMSKFTAREMGVATIVVSRTIASQTQIVVNYRVEAGTASAGSDFTPVSGYLNFYLPGVMSLSFPIRILGDTLDEDNETVNLILSELAGGEAIPGAQSTAVLEITDNDTAGTLQFKSAAYTVSESGPSLTVTVARTGGAASEVTVDYASGGGSAAAGADYAPASGTLSFGPGTSSRTFTLAVAEDTLDEANETIQLILSNPQGGAVLGPQSTSLVTINDNDFAGTAQFQVAVQAVSESDPSVLVTVVRTGGTASAATVEYATSDGSASAGSDYTAASGTLTFAAGETSKTFAIPILDDPADEANETIQLTLSNPSGGLLVGPVSTALVFIVDND